MSRNRNQAEETVVITEEQIKSALRRVKVKIRWAKGGELGSGEFDEQTGLVYATRARREVIASLHGSAIEWVSYV
jgi:hypothetical protein